MTGSIKARCPSLPRRLVVPRLVEMQSKMRNMRPEKEEVNLPGPRV
jgi:hypothetical protein